MTSLSRLLAPLKLRRSVPNAAGVTAADATAGTALLAPAPLAGSDRAAFGLVDGGWVAGAGLRCINGADERITAEYGAGGDPGAAAAGTATQERHQRRRPDRRAERASKT